MTQDLSGKQLGDYKLIRQFASGGMAHIYLGEDTNLGRKAAIKVLTPDMGATDNVLKERFEREARAVANLEHPNIVPIYQFQKVDNLYFIAMRFVEGNDLADEVKIYRNRNELMPPQRWLPILKQVAAALDHAHLRGIIHRDVKPSNILLDENDRAYLSDFGLVLWEEVDKTLGTAFGTPRYISPEQATDSQQAVSQSDIYSLAVIVYELVTGKVLFTGKTPMEVALSHITEAPIPPRTHNTDLPSTAQNEIMKALQKDSTKRHLTATEFITKLEEAYDLESTTSSRDDDFVADNTMPIRPDTEEEISESSREILDSWDVLPKADDSAKPVEVIRPKATADNSQSRTRLPMLIGAGAVVLAVIAFAIFGLNSGGGGGNSGNGNMLIRYNGDFFSITNVSETDRLLIGDLSVVGRSSEPEGRDYKTNDLLEPGECVWVIRNNVSPSDLPDTWEECSGSARATVRNDAGIYWRKDANQDNTFTVSASRRVATCNTWEEGGALDCRITWSETEIVEE